MFQIKIVLKFLSFFPQIFNLIGQVFGSGENGGFLLFEMFYETEDQPSIGGRVNKVSQ